MTRSFADERLEAAVRSGWLASSGPDRRRAATTRVHEHLGALWSLVGPAGNRSSPGTGLALACVGSLARAELGPCSDIDLVLLYDRGLTGDVDALANKLWYPLWDGKLKIDHSVRTPAECVRVAGEDVSAAIGLLDLTLVAGDDDLVSRTRSQVADLWRRKIRAWVVPLIDSVTERGQVSGEAAHLLEPDLKEARGGLRDVTVLRALTASWLVDVPHESSRDTLADQQNLLLDVRDALHASTGRAVDRLLLTEVDAVAALLHARSADALRMRVSLAARHISHALDLTLRNARQAAGGRRRFGLNRGPQLSHHPPGLIIHDGEVGLDGGTDPGDPVVGLRAGSLAASRGLPLSPTTATNIGRAARPISAPWPVPPREALVDLLATGSGLVSVWEALDLAGAIVTWIPAWEGIRSRPQHSPLHRHTVDRHTVEAVAQAQRFLTSVSRPDLLLLAVLLHDIGKVTMPATDGVPSAWAGSDHADVGAPIAAQVMTDLGYPEPDVRRVTGLVRHHLTLAELATRRDHADPATMSQLLAAVDHDPDVLTMLRCLTEADACAAGPAAWSSWRAQLINGLTERALAHLDEQPMTATESATVDLGLARSVALDRKPRVRYDPRPGGVEITVAATDHLGLFAQTAGLFVQHRISIRSALLATVDPRDQTEGSDQTAPIAVNTWRVDKLTRGDLPDPAYLVNQLERLESGDTDALAAVRRRELRSRPATEPVVRLLHDASSTATVIEVRAADRTGLLWALGSALSECRLAVRSAHISTLAGQALDTFYLTEPDGTQPAADRGEQAVRSLSAAARGGDIGTSLVPGGTTTG